MIVGFTGTRDGMTVAQRESVKNTLLAATEAHHGDCVGADEQFHYLCKELDIPIIIHPPSDPKARAFCEGARLVLPERPYLDRNKDIVVAATLVVATPRELVEPPPARGQGTWSTVRYARKMHKRLYIWSPTGERL